MRLKQNGAFVLLVAALLAVGYGVYRTSKRPAPAPTGAARRASFDRTITIDQSSLITAEQLVRQPTAPEERPFAEDAVRFADQDVDLAFAQAVRMAASQTRPLSPEAKALDTQLQHGLRTLAADQALVAELTSAIAKATPTTIQSLTDRLNLAKAQAALDQDEVDDVRADLRRAGGDQQGRLQTIIQEHDAVTRTSDSVRVNVVPAVETHGLVQHLQALDALRTKEAQLADAKAAADSMAEALKRRHDRMEARAAARRDSISAHVSHDSTAVLLAATQRRALNEKARATLDQRVDNQHRLAEVYSQWTAVVVGQERVVLNRTLRGIGVILVIALLGLIVARWTERRVDATTMDRRRTQTMRMVTRVTLQVIAVVLCLLVIFGRPNNLGTFLGLAGAGLTVALKDFIIAFLGWFVLMAKNGIRIGDLVEINGVTGEVVDLGLFYTVLLETGSWNQAGHPTGRRVSFTNGFAIEGHYFNFSTSAQWAWDEVSMVVPTRQDANAIVEVIQHEIETSTAESARQAHAEWTGARGGPRNAGPPVAPAISVRPIAGGVEIVARYITRATERTDLRAKLYHAAMERLGGVEPARGGA